MGPDPIGQNSPSGAHQIQSGTLFDGPSGPIGTRVRWESKRKLTSGKGRRPRLKRGLRQTSLAADASQSLLLPRDGQGCAVRNLALEAGLTAPTPRRFRPLLVEKRVGPLSSATVMSALPMPVGIAVMGARRATVL